MLKNIIVIKKKVGIELFILNENYKYSTNTDSYTKI